MIVNYNCMYNIYFCNLKTEIILLDVKQMYIFQQGNMIYIIKRTT